MRDTGPLFVRDRSGALAGADFDFNGWGGKYEPYDADASLGRRVLEDLGVTRHAVACVLEGGAVDVDGEGTLITTETVLLHPSRNPAMTRVDLEDVLRRQLGAERVIWLAGGLVEDRDTDGHVDNVCHFVGPGTGARADGDRSGQSQLRDLPGERPPPARGPRRTRTAGWR